MTSWSKLHYEEVARLISRRRNVNNYSGLRSLSQKEAVIRELTAIQDDFAWIFAQDNPIFDLPKFRKACLPESHEEEV